MTKRGVSLLLDALMLFSFTVLMSWRLTGVPIHEWLAVVLLGLIVVHLVVHWGWVETRTFKAVRTDSRRTRINVLLNVLLFLAMGTALATGFYMSKVVVPNTLTPGAYLNWHQAHDTASTITLVILGLHVALNWDLIVAALRRAVRRDRVIPASIPHGRGATLARSIRGLAWITAASGLVAVVTWEAGGLAPPRTKIMFQMPDGRMEEHEPPPELTVLDPGAEKPSPSRGAVPFVLRFVMLSAVAVAGRKALKLRLD